MAVTTTGMEMFACQAWGTERRNMETTSKYSTLLNTAVRNVSVARTSVSPLPPVHGTAQSTARKRAVVDVLVLLFISRPVSQVWEVDDSVGLLSPCGDGGVPRGAGLSQEERRRGADDPASLYARRAWPR